VNTMRLLQVLLSVAGISVGQLLLKLAAVNMSNPRVPGVSVAGYVVNLYLVVGVAVLGVSTLLWVWVLRTVPLGIAYPFMALAFIIVPALSYFVLGEPFGWKTAGGSLLIVAGVALIST
jgi:drug/metabolite transporter (DMT)-like permease